MKEDTRGKKKTVQKNWTVKKWKCKGIGKKEDRKETNKGSKTDT